MVNLRKGDILMVAIIYLEFVTVLAQLSKPIASNKQVDVSSNKYLQRTASDDDHSGGM